MAKNDQVPPAEGASQPEESRRAMLRRLAAGVGIVAGASALPEQWIKPVVETVAPPAQAQSTTTTLELTTTAVPTTSA